MSEFTIENELGVEAIVEPAQPVEFVVEGALRGPAGVPGQGILSVSNIAARNALGADVRREGMVVYTVADQSYWQLKPAPWTGTDSDWLLLWDDHGPGVQSPDFTLYPQATQAQETINEAIEAASLLPRGGSVFLKSGFYGISGQTDLIRPRSNVKLYSDGAILRNIDGWPVGVPSDDIDAAPIIQDDGTDWDDFVVEGIQFEGNRTLGSTSCAIHLSGDLDPANVSGAVINNITVRNCIFRHMQLLPVKIFGLRGKMIISGCEFFDNADPGFGFNEEVIFVGNHSLNSHDNGVSLSRGNNKVVCVGNTIDSPNLYGIWMSGYNGDTGPVDFVCCGNVVKNPRRSGISLIGSPQNGTISGNFVDMNFNRPIDGIDGIQVYGDSSLLKATNLLVGNNTILNAPRSGIALANCKNISVVGNLIVNTGTATKANGSTILSTDVTSNIGIMTTQMNNSNLWIDGNHIIDDRAVPLCNWDIWKINSNASGISIGSLGNNHSTGMRNSYNSLDITAKSTTGLPLSINVNGPDASPNLEVNMQGSGETQVRGGNGLNLQAVTVGTGSVAMQRFSSGTPTAKIGGITFKRSDPFTNSFMAFNLLAAGTLTASDSTAPFYLQGLNSGSHYAGLITGLRHKRRGIADAAVTVVASDYIVALSSLTAPHSVTLPSAVQATGQTFIIKDETNTASTNNLTINTFNLGTVVFTDTDVDATNNVLHLGTNIVTGTPVSIATAGVMPGGLSVATTYYVTRNTVVLTNVVASGGTIVNDASAGTGAWSNPGNAGVSDNTYATWQAVGAGEGGTDAVDSNYLWATNFGFAIPAAASIEGIQVKVEAKSATVIGANNLVSDASIQLIKAGTIQGLNKATGGNFTSSDAVRTYGTGSNDLWGLTLTAAQVNASDFGLAVQLRSVTGLASVDNMTITVYYTLPNDIKLATTLSNALAGTAIDITTTGSGTFNMTSTAQTIDGVSSKVVNLDGGVIQLYSDGANWQVQGGIYSSSQNIVAQSLKSATTIVDVSAATAPSSGKVLTATDSTHATWQTPASDVSSNTATSVDSEVVLFSSTTGKVIKRASSTGIAKLTSGVLSTVTAPSGAIVGTTDNQTLTNKLIMPTISVLTDGATPALDASLGNVFRLTAAGDRTIAVPSNPTDGQKIIIEHTASGGARTLALNSGTGGFLFGSDITTLTITASGKTDLIGCVYNLAANKWWVAAYTKGF